MTTATKTSTALMVGGPMDGEWLTLTMITRYIDVPNLFMGYYTYELDRSQKSADGSLIYRFATRAGRLPTI